MQKKQLYFISQKKILWSLLTSALLLQLFFEEQNKQWPKYVFECLGIVVYLSYPTHLAGVQLVLWSTEVNRLLKELHNKTYTTTQLLSNYCT